MTIKSLSPEFRSLCNDNLTQVRVIQEEGISIEEKNQDWSADKTVVWVSPAPRDSATLGRYRAR